MVAATCARLQPAILRGFESTKLSPVNGGPGQRQALAVPRRSRNSWSRLHSRCIRAAKAVVEPGPTADCSDQQRWTSNRFGPSRRELLVATTGGLIGLQTNVAEAQPKSLYGFTVKYKEEDLSLGKYKNMVRRTTSFSEIRFGRSQHSICVTPAKRELSGSSLLVQQVQRSGVRASCFPMQSVRRPGSRQQRRRTGLRILQFPVFDKIDVKGPAMSPVYDFLKSKQPGEIEWNYVKFLVDRNGVPVRRYKPGFDPVNFEEDLVATLAGRPLPPKQRVYLGAP
ncbi:hypothetical protein KFL_003560110 [Klebsormidium nitens]|uniref:Glutathione peroxidase n=1 Tax=Klebsormidium nitens TaxID=105231 RepID=A0A1Y1I925_KLENI|nr:hypothetical protein KFL_003560110 [Klebsormidium nitens]|eukprot:GAQ87484.1 hypothetical protein KFL_003560110 [Klebsormidium nitens]